MTSNYYQNSKKKDSSNIISSKCNGVGKSMLKQYFDSYSSKYINVDSVQNDYLSHNQNNQNINNKINIKVRIQEDNNINNISNISSNKHYAQPLSNKSKNLVKNIINKVI